MKKIIFKLSVLATVAAPLTTVVACGNANETIEYKLLPTYTAQADQLLALGITPDYYPFQESKESMYDYLTDPAKFMEQQSESFKKDFATKLKSLTSGIKGEGRSWWNQFAGEDNPNPEYWSRMKTDLLLAERYLLDDDEKILDSSIAPKHYSEQYIETNFRMSRDPYSRNSKETFDDFNDKTAGTYGNLLHDVLEQETKEDGTHESPLWDDSKFINDYTNRFVENDSFADGSFDEWIFQDDEWLYNSDPETDAKLRDLIEWSLLDDDRQAAGFTEFSYKGDGVEPTTKSLPTSKAVKTFANSTSGSFTNVDVEFHHPIYEVVEAVGDAPMFEGTVRDTMLYLFDLAYQLNEQANTTAIKTSFKDDARLAQMQAAASNAEKINSDLRTRLSNLKIYLDEIISTVADKTSTEDLTFALATIAPVKGGETHGMSTIQSISKFSWLYKELGFAQPISSDGNSLDIPSEADTEDNTEISTHVRMDDNGWFWNLGEGYNVQTLAANFKDSADLGVVTVEDIAIGSGNAAMTDTQKKAVEDIYKGDNTINELAADYDLWNEGIKTPFVFHMILDKVVSIVEDYVKTNGGNLEGATTKADATSWGNYFTVDYIK